MNYAEFTETVSTQSKTIRTVEGRVNSQTARMGAIERELAFLAGRIRALEAENASMRKQASAAVKKGVVSAAA